MTDVQPCGKCGRPHVNKTGRPTCAGHISGGARPERKGEPCMGPAMRGQTKCKVHGGRSRQARAGAARRQAEEKARKLAAQWATPVITTPVDAILGRIAAYAGHVDFYREQVERLSPGEMVWGVTKHKDGGDDRGTTQELKPNIWITLYNEASTLLVKFAAEALRAGVEERRIRLAEEQGQLVAKALRGTADAMLAALTDAGMDPGLAKVFRSSFSEAAPRHLRLLEGGAA